MKTCRLKDAHYLNLLEQSGVNPTVLNFYYDHFKNIIGRPPTLREIPGANSSNYLETQLESSNGFIKEKRLLEFTNSKTIDEAINKLNTEYNDQIIKISKVGNNLKLDLIQKPSKFTKNLYSNLNSIQSNSFINITDGEILINENEYLNQASKTNILLHNPNSVYTNICKELSAKHNINSFKIPNLKNLNIVQGINSKNKQPNIKIYLNNYLEKGYFEIIKDKELGFYSLYCKTTEITKKETELLLEGILNIIPEGACVSNYEEISEDLLKGLKKSLNKVGDRLIKNNTGNIISVPVFQKQSSINTKLLPTQDLQKIQNQFNNSDNENINNTHILNILNTLKNTLGINTFNITSQDIKNSSELSKIPNILNASAFIHNGNIYVNTDFASTDSATHELLHILLGHYKSINYNNYMSLVEQSSQFPSFQRIAANYKNRVQSDIYEEVFVEELAKWFSGKNSTIDQLDSKKQYELQFSIYNVLDSIIMGNESIESFKKLNPLDFSIKELSQMLDKKELDSKSIITNSASSRALSNLKEKLINNNDLIEIC